MSSRTTPNEPVEFRRTDYRDGGVLSAAALAGDSATSVAAWEMHQCNAHIGGIVAGLFVTIEKTVEKTKIHISPGAAIDSWGRMLLVGSDFQPALVPTSAKCFAVWLRYNIEHDSNAASDLTRFNEAPRLEVTELDDIAESCENVASTGVLLAYIRTVVATPGKFEIETCRRRYVGAVGNRIDSPSGRARVVLGPQFPRDPRRFAIGIQAAAEEPIRDVLAWESTGSIRLSATTSVALPHEKQTLDGIEQPPIVVVGSPTVQLTPEDILDPCRVWEFLQINDADGKKIGMPSVMELLSSCDRADLAAQPTCRIQLVSLLVRALNRLIRKAADEVHDFAQWKYEPTIEIETVVVDKHGHEFTVKETDTVKKTCKLTDAQGKSTSDVSWREVQPRNWSPATFLTIGNLNASIFQLLSRWRSLPGDYLCRVLLDHFLGDAIRPLKVPTRRGLYFSGSVSVDPEPQACRIHLVEYKRDGQTFRQLRITIPDPGKENNPHRYRCSFGTTLDCRDPASPGVDNEKIWNQQTSWPRGILSVLADKSIDIHNQLNVFPSRGSIFAGLILKLKPEGDSATGAGNSGRADGGSPTPILGNAVVWDGQRVQRNTQAEITIGGTLRNITDWAVEALQVLVSIYGKHDTDHGPTHTEVVSEGNLGAKSSVDLTTLAGTDSVKVKIPAVFQPNTIVVSMLVMGVNRQNEIICSKYTEEFVVPPPPPSPA